MPKPPDPVALAARLGPNLKRLREAAGLTQAALAGRAGVTQGDLSRYERGDIAPHWLTACRLAHALGVGVGELAR